MKNQRKMVGIIDNGHSTAKFREMAERWVNHQGPHLTLAEVNCNNLPAVIS